MPRMRLFKFVGKVLPLAALIVGVVWAALHDQKFLSGCASREPKNGSGDRVRQRRPAACSWGHHCDALGITAGRASLHLFVGGKNRSENLSVSLSAHGTISTLPCRRRTGRLLMVAMIGRVCRVTTLLAGRGLRRKTNRRLLTSASRPRGLHQAT